MDMRKCLKMQYQGLCLPCEVLFAPQGKMTGGSSDFGVIALNVLGEDICSGDVAVVAKMMSIQKKHKIAFVFKLDYKPALRSLLRDFHKSFE